MNLMSCRRLRSLRFVGFSRVRSCWRVALFINICSRRRVRRSKREEADDTEKRMNNSGGLAASLASPGRARAFCFGRRLERRGQNVYPYEYRCNVRIVVTRPPVERRIAIMRSYNIATPRNDIKFSQQWMRDLPALTAVKSGPFRTLRFAMKILLNVQAYAVWIHSTKGYFSQFRNCAANNVTLISHHHRFYKL